MLAVVSTLAAAAGMDARAPGRAHVHAVLWAHLLLHGHSIDHAQDHGRQPPVCSKMMGKSAVSTTEASF
jgi:hypothetical protein